MESPLTPQETQDLRNARPQWADRGIIIRPPQFVQSVFESRAPKHSELPRRKKDEDPGIPFPAIPGGGPGPCCFYSYNNGIGNPPSFPFGDCPATVLYGPTAILFALTSAYTYSNASYPNITIFADPIDFGTWAVEITGPSTQLYDSACLFGPYAPAQLPPGNTYVFDNFKSAYAVSGIFGTQMLARTADTVPVTLTQGSCVWTGGDWTLQYNSSGANAYNYTLTDPGGNTYTLTGSQTGPAGSGTGVYGPYAVM